MRVILNLIMAAAVAYAAILLLVFLFQPRLVYFPQVERELTTTPRAAGLDYEDVSLHIADGVKLHGWWVPARNARGAVLLMHGNAGNISQRLGYLTMFNRLGYSVLLFDYRGYGKSGGNPGEEGTYWSGHRRKSGGVRSIIIASLSGTRNQNHGQTMGVRSRIIACYDSRPDPTHPQRGFLFMREEWIAAVGAFLERITLKK